MPESRLQEALLLPAQLEVAAQGFLSGDRRTSGSRWRPLGLGGGRVHAIDPHTVRATEEPGEELLRLPVWDTKEQRGHTRLYCHQTFPVA